MSRRVWLIAAICASLVGLGLWLVPRRGATEPASEDDAEELAPRAQEEVAGVRRDLQQVLAGCAHAYFGGTAGERLIYRLERAGERRATITLGARDYDSDAAGGRVAYYVEFDDGRGDRRTARIELDCDAEQAEDPLEGMLTAGLELRIPPMPIPSTLAEGSRDCVTHRLSTLRLERCMEVRSLRSEVHTPAGDFTAAELLRTDRLLGQPGGESVSRVWLVAGVGVVRREQMGDGSVLVLEQIESRR